ncbi:hypothetical protein LLE39_11070 [Neisseria gonorrhoeae]|uniref:hypothetical protein n=1 Tax=Neisseria gonorrhoeae TaxID=485 RepID=UPI0021DA00C7|nr:hypothetical protein [Neisseria gonorrhoeae]UYA69865.1 hypothetical protein LLE39_11070 [Neisseria gonorrhoeae]
MPDGLYFVHPPYVLKHRPEPDIIRPSTSVKIFLTGQTDIRAENESSPQKTFSFFSSSLLFSFFFLLSSAAQAASEGDGGGRMCRRI